MANFFSDTAAGIKHMPQQTYHSDLSIFRNNQEVLEFYKFHDKLQGNFDKHFFTSIPYILEEECRLGSTIIKYLSSFEGTKYLYTLGTAEATMARTIGILGKGKIKSFSCSPTKANEEAFYLNGTSGHSKFMVAPYYEITNENINRLFPEYKGFDIIIEDTTFQMYSNERSKQIAFVKKKLKHDGIIGFIEKFTLEDGIEYKLREEQKDLLFKRLYFTNEEIQDKRSEILNTMDTGEVTLSVFKKELQSYFKYAVVIWNCGNFYSVLASDNKENLADFIKKMPKVFIPEKFLWDKVPFSLYGMDDFVFE